MSSSSGAHKNLSGFVHLCIDLQKGQFFALYDDEAIDIINSAISLREMLARYNVPTVHVACLDHLPDKDKGLSIGSMRQVCNHVMTEVGVDLSYGNEYSFAIPVQEHELVATKGSYSAVGSEPLMDYLRSVKAHTVILSGVYEARTATIDKSCVTRTAADLVQKGFKAIIALDSTNNQFCRLMNLADRQAIHQPHGVALMDRRSIAALMEPAPRHAINLSQPQLR